MPGRWDESERGKRDHNWDRGGNRLWNRRVHLHLRKGGFLHDRDVEAELRHLAAALAKR